MGIAADLRLEDVDLADHDNFAERVPHEMFALLRREDPVHFQHEPDGPGFWCSHALRRHQRRRTATGRPSPPRRGGTSLQDLRPTRSRRASR